MRCNHDNHTDQSDFEDGKTPDLDLRETKSIVGQVRSGEGPTNGV